MNNIQGAKYWKNRKLDDDYCDWRTNNENWIKEYWESKDHSHRKQIISILRKLDHWDSLLDIGCNCGTNLRLISEKFKDKKLTGMDINKWALNFGRKNLSGVKFIEGNIEKKFPFKDKEFSCSLIDAVLMYIDDKNIETVISEINRVTKKVIILCEWYDINKLGVLNGGHYARNYSILLSDFGWKVKTRKIIWPTSKKWETFGKLFIAIK